MPALPSPGHVIRIVMTYTDGSDTNIQNHFYCSYTGSVSSGDATSINTAVHTAWNASMAPLQTANIILETVTTTDLFSATGVEVTGTFATLGTNAGTKLASGVAMVMQHHVARRFRGGHSRVYIPGLPEQALGTANTWATANVTSTVSAWSAILGAPANAALPDLGTVANVQVSYYSGFTSVQNPVTMRYRNIPKVRATPLVDTINSVSGNPRVASQRRRNKQSA